MKYILKYFDVKLQQEVATEIEADTDEKARRKAIKILNEVEDYAEPGLYDT